MNFKGRVAVKGAAVKGKFLKGRLGMKAHGTGMANFIGKLCGGDILEHCGDVTPGDGGIEACLAEKNAVLSQTCSQALASMPK